MTFNEARERHLISLQRFLDKAQITASDGKFGPEAAGKLLDTLADRLKMLCNLNQAEADATKLGANTLAAAGLKAG